VESKILNFPDAMRLAQIVSKYIDTVSINAETNILEFLDGMLDKISPTDYVDILQLLFSTEITKLSTEDKNSLIKDLIEGLNKNRIPSLLVAHSKIGFING
jgi:hypothetical protein